MDNKLSEERLLLAGEIDQARETLSRINKDIKKTKEYIRSLNLLEEKKYDNEHARRQYAALLRLLKKYHVDMDSVSEEFRRQTRAVRNADLGLEFGQKGEKKAAQAIALLGSKVISLQNLRLTYNNLDIEHDLVIIAPTGIFSVEVKNKKYNGSISEKGILKSGSHSENLIEQIRRHTNSLRRYLDEIYKKQPQMKKKLEVYPIILWANDHSSVRDYFKEVPVCYINRLEYEIFKKDKYKAKLSRNEMEDICSKLKKHKQQNRVYPLCVDKHYLEELSEYCLSDLKKELEQTTRQLRIAEYDLRMLDKKIQKKENSLFARIGGLFSREGI